MRSLSTAFSGTLMDKDFIDKLVEHGICQLVEVLILVNQSDKAVCGFLMLLIISDSLFKCCNLGGKCRLFLCVLCIQNGISGIGEFAQYIILIDFTEQNFQFRNTLF